MRNGKRLVVVRSRQALTFVAGWPQRHIQLILAANLCISDIIGNFDVDSCQFAYDGTKVKQAMAEGLRLGVLEGIDPTPTNVCAAGGLCLKSGALPPSTGSIYCLLRLEVNPNFSRSANDTPRAAARLTVRASHPSLSEEIVRTLSAHFSGQ